MDDPIRQLVANRCAAFDIPLVGFAPASRWDEPLFKPWVPEAFRPRAIYPETTTVIVIGLPVPPPVLESAPSVWYRDLYITINSLLDQAGYRIAAALTADGHPSVPIPRDGYGSIGILKERPVAFFSHRHAALLAGLGNFGTNNMLLTPQFGPRVRFASVFTTARIEPDPLLLSPLCTRCGRCAEACPVDALDGGNYPASLTDKKACATRSEALAKRYTAPCGLCILACPVGEDLARFGRNDPMIFDEGNPAFEAHRRARDHVRSYGGR